MTHVKPDRPVHGDARDALTYYLDRGEVLETPVPVLREHPLTPQVVAFVRNSNPYPSGTDTLAPVPSAGTLEITLPDGVVSLPVARLRDLPFRELEAVMQCAGNGRTFYRDADRIEGCPWSRGGVMNGVWGGTRVVDVLREAGIENPSGVAYLTATGADDGDGYEKSVPLADALEFGLLVHTLNGEPLSGAHGGPVRLVMPGYFGTVNVKWLRRLALTARETDHEAQQQRYRIPLDDGTSRPCWRQPIKSLILSPCDGDPCVQDVRLSGVAFNDGACHIARVEVSLDRGGTWQATSLTRGTSTFAWTRWHLDLALPPGSHEAWSRATDELGRVQPLDGNVTWNPDGYEWHGVDRVRFEVR